ncbi:YIP1 family protein [Paracoccus sp. 11-3]|uniref:YIP1 family protein n=1 Tax=Paracoccus amoyensis TaxID=2760093 RepID=A0A926JBJ6_9RHOB|nr:YIP1 family protein [Paracoccus amoyensis]MBC9247166.1 YIP1 family protein [Paracoccus amoyensis]
MNFEAIKTLFLSTFRDPRGMAKWLIAQNFPIPARWIAVVLVAVVSALLSFFWQAILDARLPTENAAAASPLDYPLFTAAVQVAAIVISAAAMAFVGRLFGGKGRFEDAMVLTAWTEFVMIPVECVHLLLVLLLPSIASITGIAVVVLFFWLTVQFIMALHGFASAGKVALGMFATLLVLGLVLYPFAAMLGLLPELPQ